MKRNEERRGERRGGEEREGLNTELFENTSSRKEMALQKQMDQLCLDLLKCVMLLLNVLC